MNQCRNRIITDLIKDYAGLQLQDNISSQIEYVDSRHQGQNIYRQSVTNSDHELVDISHTHSSPKDNKLRSNIYCISEERDYDGPYSSEEVRFIQQFGSIHTTEDIIALCLKIEHQFKIRRLPCDMAQKLYSMGMINRRLRTIYIQK